MNYEDELNPAAWIDEGKAAFDQYWINGQVQELDKAVKCFYRALDLTSTDASEYPGVLNYLGRALHEHYSCTGNRAELEAAINSFQHVLEVTPLDALDYFIYLNNLGMGLHSYYKLTLELKDLQATIRTFQQALKITPLDDPNRLAVQSNLGLLLYIRYTHTGKPADLEAAISTLKHVLEVTSTDASERPTILNSLGTALIPKYERTRELIDLEAAISAFQQALDATPLNGPDRPAILSNLVAALNYHYNHTGNLVNLEASIPAFQQALEIAPSGARDRPGIFSNLGAARHFRYIRTRDPTDLEAAIKATRQALDATPHDPTMLSNLGVGLHDRYARMGDLADLEESIRVIRQALDVTPFNAPGKIARLNNLSAALLERYICTRNLVDLEESIRVIQQALDATPLNGLDRPTMLTVLGLGLSRYYIHTEDLSNLDAAISALRQALDTVSSDSPDRPTWLNNLGLVLRARYDSIGNLVNLEAAITAWETRQSELSLHFEALPVVYKLGQQSREGDSSTYLVTAYLEHAMKQPLRARVDLRSALIIAEGNKSRLLTQLVGRGPLPIPTKLSPQIAKREQQLLANLTTLDTQEMIAHGHAAITWKEPGRLYHLQQRQAALNELLTLWTTIGRSGSEGKEYVALRRSEALTWQNLKHLVKQAGSNIGLLSFFITPQRVLLFLLRAGWQMPRFVEAPLNEMQMEDILDRFTREVKSGLRRSETWHYPLCTLFVQAKKHLEGVEQLIVSPAGRAHLLPWAVLAERIDWLTANGCPVPLVTLPTLGVLPRLRQRPHVSDGLVLVIGNPRGDLPFAEEEAKEVAELFGMKPLLRAEATTSVVLARFSGATLIHLATHASFNADDPLDSGIVLADGVLTARDVLQHRLQADLLVLSACESGQMGSLGGEELAGLIQAFLQAGVRSLVVSLWRVNDPATAAFIQAFYTAWQAGADKALALRQAMTQIQQDPRWTHPYYWGAFVLIGDWN